MIVAFEGMDGSGKSSVASEVSKRVDFTHETQRIINIMGINEDEFSKLVRTVRTSSNSKLGFMFYTFRCMLDLEKKDNTIVERSMMSTYYFEHTKASINEFDYVMQLGVIPDVTFLLYASSSVRYKRIHDRDINDSDLKSGEALFDGYPIMLEFAHRYDIPYIGIDTEKYSYEDTIDICSSIINNLSAMDKDKRRAYIDEMNSEYGFESIYKVKERKLTNEV